MCDKLLLMFLQLLVWQVSSLVSIPPQSGCSNRLPNLLGCIDGCQIGYAYNQNSQQAVINCYPCLDCKCPIGQYYEPGNLGKAIGCQACPKLCLACSNPYFCDDGKCACHSNSDPNDHSEISCYECTKKLNIERQIRLRNLVVTCDPHCTSAGCDTTTGACSECSCLYGTNLGLSGGKYQYCVQDGYKCTFGSNCPNSIQSYGTTCLACTMPCYSCFNGATRCTSCINGYYLDVINYKCFPCTSTSCQVCKPVYTSANSSPTSNICQLCNNGQYLSSGQCYDCVNPCANCVSSTSCTSCIAGYSLIGGVCTRATTYYDGSTCVACITPCYNCTSDIICTSCIAGYNFAASIGCFTCTTPCLTCSGSSTTCASCISTYYLTGSTCQPCVSPCQTCTSSIICNSCVIGYTFDGVSSCFACTLPCLTCSGSATTCTSCISTKYLSRNTCSACVSPCATCSTITDCESCITGYYFDGTNRCFTCTSPCQACQNTAITCTSCSPQTYLSGSTCLSCVTPCATCSSSTSCNSCVDGYYFDVLQGCLSCQIGCLQCSNILTCSICIQPFYYFQNFACHICNAPCLTCLPEVDTNNNNLCLSCLNNLTLVGYGCLCQDGYYLENYICKLCDPSCQQCSSNECFKCKDQNSMIIFANKCICQNGYYDDNSQCNLCGLQCTLCKTSADNCTQCINQLMTPVNGLCSCISGYYQTSDNKCLSCDPQCATCQTSSNNCTSCSFVNSILNGKDCICQNGYFMIFPQQCTRCLGNCNICKNRDSCSSCLMGNYLSNEVCLNCPIGCRSCGITQSMIYCEICQQGYELFNQQCQQEQKSLMTTQNNSILSVSNYQTPNQIYILSNSILVQIQYINSYFNNDLEVKISYPVQAYISQIREIIIEHFIEDQYTYTAAYQGMQISFLIWTILAALLGGFEFVLAICDLIAWLSTFYYLNVTYPQNVNFIFQNINLQQFLFLPSFDMPFNLEDDDYYFTSPDKFMQNNVDPLFMKNISNNCVLIIFPVFFNLLSRLYFKVEQLFYLADCFTPNRNQNRSFAIKILQYLSRHSLYFTKYFKAIILKQIHLNMLDLVMASCLQLISNPPNQYSIVLINTVAAIITSLFILYISHLVYQSAKQDQLIHKTKFFTEQYECIYENLEVKSFDQRFYGCIILYSKILYIVFLVSCYYYPILQTSACAAQYFILIAYLFYKNPYARPSKFILEVIPNFCVLAILLTTIFLAVNEQIHVIDDIEPVGWAIIAFICISMITQFYFLLKEVITKIMEKFKQN